MAGMELPQAYFGDGVARFVEFSANGLADYVVFNYTTTDCTGQRYLSIDSDGKHIPVVTQAYYEDQPSSGTPASNGKTIWGAAPNALMSITAFSYYYQQDSYVVCQAYPTPHQPPSTDGQPMIAAPAIPVNTTARGFSPPFCQGTRPVRCGSTTISER
jgi:hypothetical protein